MSVPVLNVNNISLDIDKESDISPRSSSPPNFICKFCNKSFSTKSNLTTHMTKAKKCMMKREPEIAISPIIQSRSMLNPATFPNAFINNQIPSISYNKEIYDSIDHIKKITDKYINNIDNISSSVLRLESAVSLLQTAVSTIALNIEKNKTDHQKILSTLKSIKEKEEHEILSKNEQFLQFILKQQDILAKITCNKKQEDISEEND